MITKPGALPLALYSTRGQRIVELGSSQEPSLVSGVHLVTNEYSDGSRTISVRSVTGGAPKPVVGFGGGRELVTLAFRWPALVAVENKRPIASERSELLER